MIYLLRHGQTERNRRRTLQGRSDSPLNEQGRAEAREAARRLSGVRFDRVLSSPLVRAVETARIVAKDADIAVDERLIEMDYGPYEGMSLDAPAPEVLAFFADFAHVPAPAGMEQLADVVRRTGDFLEDLRATQGDVLVSTHAIAMKGMLEYLTPESHGSFWSKYLGNCEIWVVDFDDDGFGVPRKF
jgi:broad specificity phosphatase PhoE